MGTYSGCAKQLPHHDPPHKGPRGHSTMEGATAPTVEPPPPHATERVGLPRRKKCEGTEFTRALPKPAPDSAYMLHLLQAAGLEISPCPSSPPHPLDSRSPNHTAEASPATCVWEGRARRFSCRAPRAVVVTGRRRRRRVPPRSFYLKGVQGRFRCRCRRRCHCGGCGPTSAATYPLGPRSSASLEPMG